MFVKIENNNNYFNLYATDFSTFNETDKIDKVAICTNDNYSVNESLEFKNTTNIYENKYVVANLKIDLDIGEEDDLLFLPIKTEQNNGVGATATINYLNEIELDKNDRYVSSLLKAKILKVNDINYMTILVNLEKYNKVIQFMILKPDKNDSDEYSFVRFETEEKDKNEITDLELRLNISNTNNFILNLLEPQYALLARYEQNEFNLFKYNKINNISQDVEFITKQDLLCTSKDYAFLLSSGNKIKIISESKDYFEIKVSNSNFKVSKKYLELELIHHNYDVSLSTNYDLNSQDSYTYEIIRLFCQSIIDGENLYPSSKLLVIPNINPNDNSNRIVLPINYYLNLESSEFPNYYQTCLDYLDNYNPRAIANDLLKPLLINIINKFKNIDLDNALENLYLKKFPWIAKFSNLNFVESNDKEFSLDNIEPGHVHICAINDKINDKNISNIELMLKDHTPINILNGMDVIINTNNVPIIEGISNKLYKLNDEDEEHNLLTKYPELRLRNMNKSNKNPETLLKNYNYKSNNYHKNNTRMEETFVNYAIDSNLTIKKNSGEIITTECLSTLKGKVIGTIDSNDRDINYNNVKAELVSKNLMESYDKLHIVEFPLLEVCRKFNIKYDKYLFDKDNQFSIKNFSRKLLNLKNKFKNNIPDNLKNINTWLLANFNYLSKKTTIQFKDLPKTIKSKFKKKLPDNTILNIVGNPNVWVYENIELTYNISGRDKSINIENYVNSKVKLNLVINGNNITISNSSNANNYQVSNLIDNNSEEKTSYLIDKFVAVIPTKCLEINNDIVRVIDKTNYAGGTRGDTNPFDKISKNKTVGLKSLINYSIIIMIVDVEIKNAINKIEYEKNINKKIFNLNNLSNQMYDIFEFWQEIYNKIVHCIYNEELINNNFSLQNIKNKDYLWLFLEPTVYFINNCEIENSSTGIKFEISKERVIQYFNNYAGIEFSNWCDVFLSKYWCIIIDEAHQQSSESTMNLIYYMKQLVEWKKTLEIFKNIVLGKLYTKQNFNHNNEKYIEFENKYSMIDLDNDSKKEIKALFKELTGQYSNLIENKKMEKTKFNKYEKTGHYKKNQNFNHNVQFLKNPNTMKELGPLGRKMCEKIGNNGFRIIITSATVSIDDKDNGTKVSRFMEYFNIKPKVLSLNMINSEKHNIESLGENIELENKLESKSLDTFTTEKRYYEESDKWNYNVLEITRKQKVIKSFYLESFNDLQFIKETANMIDEDFSKSNNLNSDYCESLVKNGIKKMLEEAVNDGIVGGNILVFLYSIKGPFIQNKYIKMVNDVQSELNNVAISDTEFIDRANLNLNELNIIKKLKNVTDKFKFIFTTPVYETGQTIPNLIGVIDTGISMQQFFSPLSNYEIHMIDLISQDKFMQRKGRAGRTQAGIFIGLYPESVLNSKNKLSFSLENEPFVLNRYTDFCNSIPHDNFGPSTK